MQHATTTSRSRLLIALICIFGALFIGRLFYLQIIRHDFYEAEALKEHITKFTIPASRGLIYARDGTNRFVPLVLNEPVYTAYADPQYVKDAGKVADVMRRIAGGNMVEDFETGLRDSKRQYAVLARGLNKAQADLIKKEELKGVGLQQQDKRVYPEGQLAAQVLGFVNAENQGQYGIEEGINEDLAGKDGQLKAVTDVYGIPISVGQESVQTPPQQGKNTVLTIDRTIQHKAESLLKSGLEKAKATKGSILIMNPTNGQVLAMASLPTYNPNDFTKVTDYSVFQNGIISDPYEPGSVIKALTMGVGLNENVIQPDTTYNNTGSMQIADATIKNVLTSPTGQITMTGVLQYSFNTGAVWVLQQLGGGEINRVARQKLYDYFVNNYFFDKPTGIELAGESKGRVVAPNEADAGEVRYANMSFGQGVNMSMLQVAAAFSASINGGSYYTPQIVAGYLDDQKNFTAKAPQLRKGDTLSSTASGKLRTMLHEARVKSPIGSGDKKGYTIGGKTGTAQVYDPKTGRYSDTATIGSYLGFGGRDGAEYVIMVRVDDATIGGFSGSAAAAPIFTELSNWMLDYLQIAPKG